MTNTRWVSRIAGVLLVLCGLAVFPTLVVWILGQELVSIQPPNSLIAFYIAVGVGLIVAGVFCWRLKPRAAKGDPPVTRS